MSKNRLLEKLSIGSWIQLGHPGIAEIMASAGFDWLAIDLEHSTIGLGEAEERRVPIVVEGLPSYMSASSAVDTVVVRRPTEP